MHFGPNYIISVHKIHCQYLFMLLLASDVIRMVFMLLQLMILLANHLYCNLFELNKIIKLLSLLTEIYIYLQKRRILHQHTLM